MHVPPIVMTGLLIILHMIYTKYMYVLGCTALEWWGKQEGGDWQWGPCHGDILGGRNNIRTRCRGQNFGRMAAVGAVGLRAFHELSLGSRSQETGEEKSLVLL